MFNKSCYRLSAAITAGMIMGSAGDAFAGNTFSTISDNIGTSIGTLPGLISGLSYLFGVLLGVLGVMKIKDHVENPTQTPLKDGAIRLASGGALFALPMLFDAMFNTVGTGNQAAVVPLQKVNFAVN